MNVSQNNWIQFVYCFLQVSITKNGILFLMNDDLMNLTWVMFLKISVSVQKIT